MSPYLNIISLQGPLSGRQDMRGDGGEVGGGADPQRSLLRPQGSLQRAWQHWRSLAQVESQFNLRLQIFLDCLILLSLLSLVLLPETVSSLTEYGFTMPPGIHRCTTKVEIETLRVDNLWKLDC